MDQRPKILDSELAVEVLESLSDGFSIEPKKREQASLEELKEISSNQKGSYSSKIAEKLDKDQSAISRMLKELEKNGLVKKGERKQAQYYKINFEGLSDFILEELRRVVNIELEPGSEGDIRDFDNIDLQKAEYLIEFFFIEYFCLYKETYNKKTTLENLLFNTLLNSFLASMVEPSTAQYWEDLDQKSTYWQLIYALKKKLGHQELPLLIGKAIERIEKD